MPTVTLDAVNGAELQHSADITSYRRMGWVKDIELTEENDPDALVKVLPLLPPLGSTLGPGSTGLTFRRAAIRPEVGKFRMARLELTYDNQGPNLTPTAYLLRDRTFSVQRNSCFIPGTRVPIVVGYTDPDNAEFDVTPEPIFFNFNMSARSIELTIFMYGRPEGGSQNYVNYLNDASWPTTGVVFNQFQFTTPGAPLKTATALPRAYWRLNSYSSEYDRNKGMSLIRAEAITLVQEDWSELGMLRNELTGKFPFAGLPLATRLNVHAQMMAQPYSHGVIYPIAAPERGLTRVGPHPLTNFASLMGF